MKSIIAALVILVLAVVGSFTNAKDMNGFLESVTLHSSENCTFSINDEDTRIIQSKRICEMIAQAYKETQPVCVELRGPNYYVFYYKGHDSQWAREKTETTSFQYQLVGKVNNVRYNSLLKRCYVAVDTGYYNVRNNNVYHVTEDEKVCDRAITAFYEQKTVTMIATVDLLLNNSNDINVLIVHE